MFFNARSQQGFQNSAMAVTPIASSIVIKSLNDLQSQLAAALDVHIQAHAVPGPKQQAPAELITAWRDFPRSCGWYGKSLTRIADVAASVQAEQAVAELVMQWLPPSIGASQPGAAFLRSQFDYSKFTQKLACLSGTYGMGGADRKELQKQQEKEGRNNEVVQIVVCIVVCDVLAALLNPRPDRVGTPLDPDIGHVIVQLAFGQFTPQSERGASSFKLLHDALATALHQRTVVSWASVVKHLARLRFDQIVNEFIERLHTAKTADDVSHVLVGVQRVQIPSISAPQCPPFFDQFRQIVLSDKKLYREPLMRLCVIHSIELLVRQADVGAPEVDPATGADIYNRMHAMFGPLQEWVEKADHPGVMMHATQLLALIVCHAPPAFWQAHMDITKEGKKVNKKALLGGTKEGLLRALLTDKAYEEKSSRAALCGVLRLLTGGYHLPASIIGEYSSAEWWHEGEATQVTEGSLMHYTMRTFGERENMAAEKGRVAEEMGAGLAAGLMAAGVNQPGNRPSAGSVSSFLGGLGFVGTEGAADETTERLHFIIEKLFARKSGGRTQRLPKLLDNGAVLVYILGQVAAHSLQVGEQAIELLLKGDAEYNLLGVCALGRILRSPILAHALGEKMSYFAERVHAVIERCEQAVGAKVMGLTRRAYGLAPLKFDDSVSVLLQSVSRKKDRDQAVRLAMYREAIGCIPLAMPAACLQPHGFVGELLLHSDEELAGMASRVVQRLAIEQPHRRKDLLSCFGKMLTRLLAEPGGSKEALRSQHHYAALGGMEKQLEVVVTHIINLLTTWSSALSYEPLAIEPLDVERGAGGSQVIRLEPELVQMDASALALLGHPSSALRQAALTLAAKVRDFFHARKAAYDRAISERLGILELSSRAEQTAASEQEISELKMRIARAESHEEFVADVIEREKAAIVRNALTRELLESKGGVASELPSDAQLEKMQIPPFEKLFALPAESLAMTSQFCYCLAELGTALLRSGCVKRATLLRSLLASAAPRLPAGRDLAAYVAEGDLQLGELWRNCYCLLLSVSGGAIAATRRIHHPDSPELQARPLASPPRKKRLSLERSLIGGRPSDALAGMPPLPPTELGSAPPPGPFKGGSVVLPPPLPGALLSPPVIPTRNTSASFQPPPLPPAALAGSDDDDDDDGRPLSRGALEKAISSRSLRDSAGNGVNESNEAPGKFDRSIGGFESGWSASRSASLAHAFEAQPPSQSGADAVPALPANFNRLVSAELGGVHSEALAERLTAIGLEAGGPAASLPAQGLASKGGIAPPMLSKASTGYVGGAPPPLSASQSLTAVPPPPLLGGRAGSVAGPPPTLSGLRSASTTGGGAFGLPSLRPGAGQPPATPPPSPPPSPSPYAADAPPGFGAFSALAPLEAVAGDEKALEVMIAEAAAAVRPALTLLWQSLAAVPDGQGMLGWTAQSVCTIAGCLHQHGTLAAAESLFDWREAMPDKKRKELLLPTARTLRTVAQSSGFRAAVLTDAQTSEHQRLLQLYLGFVREHIFALADPNFALADPKLHENRKFCLELMLIVMHVAHATTTAVRYDPTRWLMPLYVPESLRNAWPLEQRAEILEALILWATWREEEAWRAAQSIAGMGTSKGAMKKAKSRDKAGLQVGSDEERLLYRLETTASTAIRHMVESGPIAAERWLTDGGSWELEPVYAASSRSGGPAEIATFRRRQTVAFFEKAELEGSETLRYVLGHHFPLLLEPFLRHVYFEPQTASVYFHAIVDAIIPPDGEATTLPCHSYDDARFAQEVRRVAPQLLLLALFHLKDESHRIRSRAFDLTCRLTSSFCDTGQTFTCDGRPLSQWRPMYTASLPSPVLLRQHVRALLKSAAHQCPSLGHGIVGEALGLLLQTYDSGSHLVPLSRLQVLQLLQVASPWFVNVALRTPDPQQPTGSPAFQFLKRLTVVGLAHNAIEGEALSSYYDAWFQLAAAGVGVAEAMRAAPCAFGEERPPPNVPILISFLLNVAVKSEYALELSQQLMLGLFTLAPHTTIDMLLAQLSGSQLRRDGASKYLDAGPEKRPSILAAVGGFFKDTFGKLANPNAPVDASGGFATASQEKDSVLFLGGAPIVPHQLRSRSLSTAQAARTTATGPARIVVILRRGPTGGLGLNLSEDNHVTDVQPGSPAEQAGNIERGDQIVAINGRAVASNEKIGPLLPRDRAPIEFTFHRDQPALAVPEAVDATDGMGRGRTVSTRSDRGMSQSGDASEAAAASMLFPDEGGARAVKEPAKPEDEEVLLLAPSGGIEGVEDSSDNESVVPAQPKELRAAALALLVEPVRQGFCDACGKQALTEALPVMLTMILTLFDSQTQSTLSIDELISLRKLLSALLSGVREARRAATGAAAAPFNERQERLPAKYAALAKGVETKGFRVRWPRLFADATSAFTTPTVGMAYEITNFLPVSDAVTGLLECVQDWGHMHVASEWATVARSWLDASSDSVVRFKVLTIVRLLIPHLADSEFDVAFIMSATRALHAGLLELESAAHEADAEMARQRAFEQQQATERGEEVGAAPEKATNRAAVGRKPPALALAEEALELLHDVAKRKAAAGSLAESDGLGAMLLWTAAAVSGSIYPTLLAVVYPMLALLLSDGGLREMLVAGGAPPPPPSSSARRDPYAAGLLQLLLSGLHAAGWWGDSISADGSDSKVAMASHAPLPAAAAGIDEKTRRHLLPAALEGAIMTTLRQASHVQASIILPAVSRGALPPPDLSSGNSGLVAAASAVPLAPASAAGAGLASPLLESLMLQLPVLYLQVRSAAALSEGQRVAYEPLVAAAAVVDKLLGDGDGVPSMVTTLSKFFDGGFGSGDRGSAAAMLQELTIPLFAAFLPSHSQLLAQTLTRLLTAGPYEWGEPLLLLVAYALQHPDSPSFVEHFHLVVQRCVDSEGEAAVYCLSAAMRAAARAGDALTAQAMASGRPFDEVAKIQFYAAEERELELTRQVVLGMAQVLQSKSASGRSLPTLT